MVHPWYGEQCPLVGPHCPPCHPPSSSGGKQVRSDMATLPAAAWDGVCSQKHTQPQHTKRGEQ